MRKPIRAAALAATLLFLATCTSGCFGRFALVRKVYGFNEQVGDKWLRSILTFGLLFIPVYEVCGLVDWVILNTIEFWSGSNPVTLGEGETLERTVSDDRGTTLHLTLDAGGDHARIEVSEPGKAPRAFDLVRTAAGGELRDQGGQLLASLTGTAEGGAEVRDGEGRLVAGKGPAELASLASAARTGALLTTLELQRGLRVATAR